MTPEEFARCIKDKLCHHCRQPGHFAANCPVFGPSTRTPQPAAVRAAATEPPTPSTSTNPAPATSNVEDPVATIARMLSQLTPEQAAAVAAHLSPAAKKDFEITPLPRH